MRSSKFLAIDIGAESGRVIVGILESEKISLEEVHRFPNKQIKVLDHIHWDILYLFDELKKGLSAAVQKGHLDIESIGIDTWGVDFGLLGKNNDFLGIPYSYRDSRTKGIMEKVFEKISREELYFTTGIQFLEFNSLFQLYCTSIYNKELLSICDKLLFMPDLFNYFLTGKIYSEYTIASTSQMLNAETRNWDERIIQTLGIPLNILPQIIQPGTIIGKLLPEISVEVGLKKEVDVISVGCHDTASAVAAVPSKERNWAFLSSGTWSVIGIENDKPIINAESLENNFANEGGVGSKIRFLMNVMGMWLLQETKKSWLRNGEDYDYDEMLKMAESSKEFNCIINPDDSTFLNPTDIPQAIKEYCLRTKQTVPITKGEFIRCILESLALKYHHIINKICTITQERIEVLHIVGGGAQNEMLNQFTADACNIPVVAGPVEATAIGNILVQAIAKGKIPSIRKGREIVANSFPIKKYLPLNSGKWKSVYEKIKENF